MKKEPHYRVLNLSAGAHVQTNPDLGIKLDGSVDFTVEAWVKFHGLSSEASILSKEGVFDFGIEEDRLVFEISGIPPILSDRNKHPLKEVIWQHVCVSYENGMVRIYIDGHFNLLASIRGRGKDSGHPFLIGRELQARLKHVRVYNRALTFDQVKANAFGRPEPDHIVTDFDFSVNPPVDRGNGKLPLTLKDRARIIKKTPGLKLEGTAYAQPNMDLQVNPGGYQTDAYTVQTWVYVASTVPARQMIFVNDDLEVDSGMALFLEYDATEKGFRVMSQRGSTLEERHVLKSNTVIPLNQWVNIATTFDGKELSIYTNGRQDIKKELGPTQQMQLESQLLIGAGLTAGVPAGSDCFQGYISRLEVWSKSLDQQDVEKYRDEVPDIHEDALQAAYDFRASPARNRVTGNTIGLADGAALHLQISHETTPPQVPQVEKEREARKEIDPAIIQQIRESIDLSDIVGELRAALDTSRKSDQAYVESVLSDAERVEGVELIEQAYQRLLENLDQDKPTLPFLVTRHVIDGEFVLICHTASGSYVGLQADAEGLDDCLMWHIELIFIIVAGILGILCGIQPKWDSRYLRIFQRILRIPGLKSGLSAGDGITAVTVFLMGQKLIASGLWKELLWLLLDFGIWAIINIGVRIITYFTGVAAAAIIAALATVVAAFGLAYLRGRKNCDELPKVTLAAIKFNHDTSKHSTDAFNIRQNYTQTVSIPEWTPHKDKPEQSPAAYAIEETTGNPLTIKAKFLINSTEPTTVAVRANGGGVLGSLDSVQVKFINSVSVPEYVPFTLLKQTLKDKGVNKEDIKWDWQFHNPKTNQWENITSTKHRIFSVLTTPESPWKPVGATCPTQHPWVDILEYACEWAKGTKNKANAAIAITKKVNGDIKLKYNSDSHYIEWTDEASFLATEFLDFLTNASGKGPWVNCADCASIVTTFANVLGCNLTEANMHGGYSNGIIIPFKCNKIIAIGDMDWKFPPVNEEFTYHEVAWWNPLGFTGFIFDACLHVDKSNDPWKKPDTERVKLLPTGMQFSTQVVTPTTPLQTPFTDLSYRERLAANTNNGIGKCVAKGSFDCTHNGRRPVK